MTRPPRGPVLTKAELRIQAEQAMAAATKPIVKLPTKLVTPMRHAAGNPTR